MLTPAAAWLDTEILTYSRSKGVFAGFGLDGATLKPDESGNRNLYGKSSTNSEIVEGGAATPAVAQPFIAKLPQESSR